MDTHTLSLSFSPSQTRTNLSPHPHVELGSNIPYNNTLTHTHTLCHTRTCSLSISLQPEHAHTDTHTRTSARRLAADVERHPSSPPPVRSVDRSTGREEWKREREGGRGEAMEEGVAGWVNALQPACSTSIPTPSGSQHCVPGVE